MIFAQVFRIRLKMATQDVDVDLMILLLIASVKFQLLLHNVSYVIKHVTPLLGYTKEMTVQSMLSTLV